MLYVYDFEFNLLFAESGIISSRWVVYYNDIGTFEAHLPITSELTKIVSENSYLVVKQNGLAAIIVGKELGEELVLYGRTCNWLLTKRIVTASEEEKVFAGEKASGLVESAFWDVENFEVENNILGDEILFANEQRQAFEAVRDCLNRSGLGHRLVFDEKEEMWRFSILSGGDNGLILSEAHKNTYNTGIRSDILDLATCGLYNRKTDDGYESTLISGDSEMSGIYRWEAKLSGDTETEAANSLDKCCEKNKISMSLNDVFCGRDYSLGDTVRLQIIKGGYRKTEKRRLCGVKICIDANGYREQPILE